MSQIFARGEKSAARRLCFLLAIGTLFSSLLAATTIVPISDLELRRRADVVVRGIVVASAVAEDALGRPETVTTISPLEVLKGSLAGDLVLHQLGGELPDGRFFKLWGRPEYTPGHEVVVFAVSRPEGDYQTAELLLGKFELQRDAVERTFAVPALRADESPGVTVIRRGSKNRVADEGDGFWDELSSPRDLEEFLRVLRRPEAAGSVVSVAPSGELRSIVHPEYARGGAAPEWDNIGALWRWNNGATAVWTLDGQANVTGGGVSEATAAPQTWNNEPNAAINYTIGTGGANPIHLDAPSSPCGWSSCMSTGGVIGCGGPGGGGTNTWRGETYSTITSGEVWLRSYCSFNLWDSITTQSVLTHELGHTLGLGHSDQGASAHDVCRGDEDAATMRSYVQHRTTLGTDDSDAVRWLYGDGGNSCGGGGGPVLTVAKAGAGGGTVTSAPAGISCGTTCSFSFAAGTTVTLSAVASSNSAFAGWSGDADCSDGSVTMSAARNCTANFNLLPDLVVSALAAPSAAVAGSTISVAETTRDQSGTGTAGASTTRYYLSVNSAWDTADIPLGSRSVVALSAGTMSTATLSLTIPAGTATGSYYILARADADSQVTESNESNNVKAVAIHVGPPDLVVSSLAAPAAGGAGLTITVSDTTHNQAGTGPAPASVTRFYLSSDGVWTSSDLMLGLRDVPALGPGDSSSASTVLTVPPGTASGTWYVIAKADADGLVAETNDGNNTRWDTIVIRPDLSVSALSAPSTGGAGFPITVSVATKNSGGGSAGASTIGFYLSANSTVGSGDVLLGTRGVPILNPGATFADSATFTIPSDTPPGSYYVIARADDGGIVDETNEANNTRTALVRLSPDLVVSSLTAPASAAAGATISVSDTTKDQGLSTAAATTTRFYLSANSTYDAALDTEIGSRAIPVLTTGQSASGSATLTIPPGTAPGTWYILARADADGQVAESNEGNNTTAKSITISP